MSPEIEALLALGKADIALSLHYIAKQGNLQLLEAQLSQCKDPDATDEKGRTAMVGMADFILAVNVDEISV